ncbi:MAG: Para-aminobenzoate synthase, amidotransferase component [uncultured Thermoleophilia bacterium]|uniref:Para-aminobenzoate synthase, amidotransferase component n=1 Tax=uncultured Thermoleophilia bacterium TaxID=1497501 RepID=A0A6J4TTY4_9ACTN|nr:MAG: Para-aminobenzoate synthase, amidotransferase component [uncultured Thermoleophilia bacterium]
MSDGNGRRHVLLIDNYDSFTWNLAHGLAEAGAEVTVRRHDAVSEEEAEALAPTHLVISPGPGRPAETGVSGSLVRRFHGRLPILGVCLGHQLIVELHGGTVERARILVHGKAADVAATGPDPLLEGLGQRFAAGRYHSLAAIRPLPDELVVTAEADDGEVMAVRHASAPTHGVQFHPESVLTPGGPRLMANFLALGATS